MSDNQIIKILGQSRDTLLFLKQMGLRDLPLAPEIEAFLGKKDDPVSRKAVSVPASKVKPEKRSSQFPALNKMMKEDENPVLEEISSDIDGCTRCSLHKSRSTILTGHGEKEARLFIIEEKPSEAEEQSGHCIGGAAGELFEKMLKAIGFDRTDVFITSIVKCRPENDRPPTDEEVNICLPFLARQIAAVKPDVIFTLGPLTAKVMTGSSLPLFRIRGKFHDFHGTPLLPSFHPSFLLKNEEMKKASWIDLQMIQKKLTEKT
jgi:uracil-DNA glycosylase family 4